jgi:hypothetical protein
MRTNPAFSGKKKMYDASWIRHETPVQTIPRRKLLYFAEGELSFRAFLRKDLKRISEKPCKSCQNKNIKYNPNPIIN